jgi:uncharacterized protein
MQADSTGVLYSAKDLINFLGCQHSTALDLDVAARVLHAPKEAEDAYLELLKEKGNAHESAYLETLKAEGKCVREIQQMDSLDEMTEATRQAMRDGVDVIYQGALRSGQWHGYSDFLLRVDIPSKLGEYSYEVADTKLARTARPKHVVQLCIYSDLVAREQGLRPKHAYVVLGDNRIETLRVEDYRHYVDVVRERFEAFCASKHETHAEPCSHCELCRWSERCADEWEATDHLQLVARLGGAHAKKLRNAGVTNLRELAVLDDRPIPKMQRETVNNLRAQARLQSVKRATGEDRVETLPLEPRRGFARLPQPNEGDLFFDMEGDPIYSADGSLEYLFGFHYVDAGEEKFTPFWARDRASEKKAFEEALDFITARMQQFPDAFVYHYASYEEVALRRLARKYGASVSAEPDRQQVDAIKRLAQQYGTREDEVDDLLRGRKLVDLYKVVREGIRTSEPSYSLKNLEVFYAPERTEAITSGGDSIVAFERWLVLGDDAFLRQIEEYNAFDCRSTRLCRDWLLSLRPDEVEWFDPRRMDEAEAEKEKEREEKRRKNDARILDLRRALVANVSEEDRAWRELLGYLLEYHRREARREWWEFFKRQEATVEASIADPDCIGGLTVDTSVPARPEKRSKVWTLRFQEQELKLGAGDEVVRAGTRKSLEIVSLDERACTLELKVGPSCEPPSDGMLLIKPGPFDDTAQREAIVRYAEAVTAGCENEYSGITSIVRRDAPRLMNGVILGGSGDSDLVSATIDAIERMDNSHLVIQGPPGTGKTVTSARAIVELLKNGKRVGVAAFTHEAINNLLRKIEAVARERGVTFTGVKKGSKDNPEQQLRGSIIEDTHKNEVATSDTYQLVAGTAWLFSRKELDRKLDYLFVDEAGQMSLASVVACGLSARNIVLVGDQMQLSQPVKGAHPGGSGVSALDHLMGNWATVPEDRGIFLAKTWRMQPDLCRFVSDAFYDGRLKSEESAAQQTLVLSGDAGGALAPVGLRFVPVEHEDRAQKSEEEAGRLDSVYRELLGQPWVNSLGETQQLGMRDILVVSPYNMQVNLLKRWLPDGARVGTVDRFQGQEGVVVLISMAASSGAYIPRGIEFLFSPNRLNVAISRARCLSIVLASPGLLGIACRSVEQMRLSNVVCWVASGHGAEIR